MALLIQLLQLFGNVIGRGAHFLAEEHKHFTNLNVVLVGRSSKGRKGSALRRVRRLLREIDAEWDQNCIQSGLSTGEGLIYAVRDADADGDPGVTDKRLLVVAEEFSAPLRVMRRDTNTLSTTIRDAWDNGTMQTLAKTCPAKATGAHISIVSHTTVEDLQHYLCATDAANGFANRFLWVAVERSQCLPEGGLLTDEVLAPLVTELRDAVDFSKRGVEFELRRDDVARELWHHVYPRLSSGKPGMFGAVTSRAEAQVMRMACIYALLDHSTTVRAEHLNAALAVWDYVEASVRYIFGDATGNNHADAIREALRAKTPDGLTRNEIREEVFHRNLSAAKIDFALSLLERYGLATCERELTGGRPAQRWRAVQGYAVDAKTAIRSA